MTHNVVVVVSLGINYVLMIQNHVRTTQVENTTTEHVKQCVSLERWPV